MSERERMLTESALRRARTLTPGGLVKLDVDEKQYANPSMSVRACIVDRNGPFPAYGPTREGALAKLVMRLHLALEANRIATQADSDELMVLGIDESILFGRRTERKECAA